MSYDEDLWYSLDATPPKPLVDSSQGSEDEGEDPKFLLPQARRKQYEKEAKKRKLVAKIKEVVLQAKDDDSDVELLDGIKSVEKRPAVEIDMELSKLNESANLVLDPHTQEILKRNQEAMENLKSVAEDVVVIDDLDDEEEDYADDVETDTYGIHDVASYTEALDEPAPSKVLLKVKCISGDAPAIRICATDPFSKLFNGFKQYALSKGWISDTTEVRYQFDGDNLGPAQTPQDLDLEGDEIIEAFWK